MASTRKILERVPEGKNDWKPHPRSMSLSRLASHVSELPGWGAVAVETETLELKPDMKPFLGESTADLLTNFDKNVAKSREAIAGASDEALAVNWSLIVGGHKVMTMPRSAVLRSIVMNHLIHHRAQLGVYLRLLDIPIPGLYGPSADEPNFG